MKPLLALAILFSATLSGAQTEKRAHEFPSEDQLQLILTQSDRAFTQYEQAIKLEAQGGSQLEQSAKMDQEGLRKTLEILERLKQSPNGFTGPAGFLIVTGLDDASRNMALCMGQAAMQASALAEDGNYAESHRLLQISQSCLDTSTLLYTVSESALDVYARYLLAENAMTQEASEALKQCMGIIQNGCKKK